MVVGGEARHFGARVLRFSYTLALPCMVRQACPEPAQGVTVNGLAKIMRTEEPCLATRGPDSSKGLS